VNRIQASGVGLVTVVDQWFYCNTHTGNPAKTVQKVQYNLLYNWQKPSKIDGNGLKAKTASELDLTRF
jgi:hypothetical protein